jgi:hypothetical protein
MLRRLPVLPLAIFLGLVAGCTAPHAETPAEEASVPAPPPRLTDAQKAAIDQLTGTTGGYDEAEDVHKVTFPRNDVKVAVDGWAFQPFMGITSWAAFTPTGENEVMVMGDLTLFEDEVNPVMSVALDNGLEVTALHNHFFYDNPQVMFMHIGGHGAVEHLAGAVRKALDKVGEIRKAAPVPLPAAGFGGPQVPAASSITAAPLDQILGVKGATNNGMYKATIGRPAKMHGREIGAQMGVNTWAAFAGSDSAAFVDGDFAVHEDELQPVLKSLRAAGINIVAIHNHMIQDEPRFIFLHYWGKGPAEGLARGLKSALDLLSD